MYTPKWFAESDPEILAAGMRDWPLATIVEQLNGRFDTNHIPLILVQAGTDQVLKGHAPKANPIGDDLPHGKSVLVIFNGPTAYITPSWLPTKQEHGRVVPTYNYEAIHVQGAMRIVDDPLWVRDQVEALTRQQEGMREHPWAVSGSV